MPTPPAAPTAAPPPPGELTVFAGCLPLSGSADGQGDAARFLNPVGVAVDRHGNAYVADGGNHTIRKITRTGQVTTFAGKPGQPGARNGRGSAARFNGPSYLAFDARGHLFVTDYNNNAIRRITPGGQVSTFTGILGGAAGVADHLNPQDPPATFSGPAGLGFDGEGNLYVADNGNFTIRKVTPEGLVSTVAGVAGAAGAADSPQGPGSDARFNYPNGLAVAGDGSLYVADASNNTIRKVVPGSGVVTTLAGSSVQVGSANGKGAAATFSDPFGLAVDRHGNLYVGDFWNNAIRLITPEGEVSTYAGQLELAGCQDGDPGVASFNGPKGLAVDAAGHLWVVDGGSNTLRKVSPDRKVSTLAGKAGGLGGTDATGTAATFNAPAGLAMDGEGNLYVADSSNFTVRKVTPAGVVTTLAGQAGVSGYADGQGEAARFGVICFLAVDGSQNVYVADPEHHVIRKVTSAGVVTTVAGTAGEQGDVDGPFAVARLNFPAGLAVDAAGENLFMVDCDSNTLRHIVPGGAVTTLVGGTGSPGQPGDGAEPFNTPLGLALAPSGILYVADSNNFTLRTATPGPSGWVLGTLAGQTGTSGNQNGTGTAATFKQPGDLRLDGTGNLYVSDSLDGSIRKLTPAGVVTTLVGGSSQPTTIPGPLPASLASPQGVAVTPAGDTVFITVANAILAARP